MKTLNSEQVKAILTAIDDLIDLKLIIRDIVPNYHLNEKYYEEFTSKLQSLYDKLNPFFFEFLNIDNSLLIGTSETLKNKILDLVNNKRIILISANAAKKKLKNIGVDPRKIIVSGGPLYAEDYKKVNIQLSENALANIKKKCEKIINQLKDQDWSDYSLVFIYENENPTDLLILERINQISKIIRKQVETFVIKSWKSLEK